MKKDNFYIFTGGPGGGKTTLLEHLGLQGYRFVGDTAREIIRQRLAKGLSPRPDPAEFAREMFERDFENFMNTSNSNKILFFDRSFVDSANLLFHADPVGYAKIEKTHLTNRFNQKVFVTPPWEEIYRTDSERDHSFDHAVAVFNELCDWYKQQDYVVVILPKDSVESRARFVLNQIKDN